MKTLPIHLVSLAIAGAFAAAAPAFADHPAASPKLGTPVHAGSADRAIALDAGTQWVNVTGGETIRFVVGDKSFSWRFDGYTPAVELRQIAPAGMLGDRPTRVYVSPDPLYSGG